MFSHCLRPVLLFPFPQESQALTQCPFQVSTAVYPQAEKNNNTKTFSFYIVTDRKSTGLYELALQQNAISYVFSYFFLKTTCKRQKTKYHYNTHN